MIYLWDYRSLMNIPFQLILFMSIFNVAFAQPTPYELSASKNVTATYAEAIAYYQQLDKKYSQLKLMTYGSTDIGKPLHLAVLSKNGNFDPIKIRKENKRIILINNGIHPGEPEGIDASMMLARDLLEKRNLPDNAVICIIPVYNIGGSLNRGTSRVNQNGPESYGFRGNYQNLDLNRDFIKTDSKNSHTFQQIFNQWQPEVFVDNHTSNGADYQYVMTLIQTQKDKLNPVLSAYMTKTMVPDLYSRMKASGYEMIPYVNTIAETPDSGLIGFLETPRYTSGYTALHNTIGFIPETHMLKPFKQRVEATYLFMKHIIDVVQRDAKQIGENKKRADEAVKEQTTFPLSWKLDTSQVSALTFKGYEAKYKKSEVSGLDRLYYDRNEPYEKQIKFMDAFVPALSVNKPVAYIVPQAWQKVIDLLTLNRVEMKRLAADTTLNVEMYQVADYKTVSRPYEGHYLHSNIEVNAALQNVKFYEGDYVIYAYQYTNRYIVETLEPQATDSFFAWNFFDTVLGQKEHFSAYVFEDAAAGLLQQDAGLRNKLEEAKKADPELSKSAAMQLNWIYENSVYFEKSYLRYPVGRLLTDIKLDLK